MTEYGLPSVRDREGDLQAVDHTFTFDGDEVSIRFTPPTIAEYEDLEEFQQRQDVDPDELENVVRDYLVKPDIPEDQSLTFRETLAYLQGIMDYSTGGAGLNEEIVEKLDEIQAEAGN